MRALCSQVVFSGFHRPDWRSWILDISRNVQNWVLSFKPGKVVFYTFSHLKRRLFYKYYLKL